MSRKKRLISKPDPVQPSTWADVQLFALILMMFVGYWNSLDGGFHFDDHCSDGNRRWNQDRAKGSTFRLLASAIQPCGLASVSD
jgi:hypothetical protein